MVDARDNGPHTNPLPEGEGLLKPRLVEAVRVLNSAACANHLTTLDATDTGRASPKATDRTLDSICMQVGITFFIRVIARSLVFAVANISQSSVVLAIIIVIFACVVRTPTEVLQTTGTGAISRER